MKSFLDLLATDLELNLSISVDPVGTPDTEIWINQRLIYQDLLRDSFTVTENLPLRTALSISVKLKNKTYGLSPDTAIILTRISLDDFDLIPQWTHLAQYQNDHDYTQPTSYIGFNGEWKIQIPKPFYQWRHEVTGQGWLLHPD